MLEDLPVVLPENWEGFRLDERGDMITRSGYKASPAIIEFALWMFECMSIEVRQYLIRSDEAPGALRPLYELSDLSDKIEPTRLRIEPEKSGFGKVADEPSSKSDASGGPARGLRPCAEIKSADSADGEAVRTAPAARSVAPRRDLLIGLWSPASTSSL